MKPAQVESILLVVFQGKVMCVSPMGSVIIPREPTTTEELAQSRPGQVMLVHMCASQVGVLLLPR